ncbi:MAG TPA: DegT/DnrJ/EryC1/StrS family aminotransferase [Pyrinomonadaceae bacterium]|nr:DegT/DnrJ/EryC1/StrS family aminotransferase [Pyrinomonadaceae bacterium]
MAISFLDLTRQNPELEAETSAALVRVYSSGHYILGPEVQAFEEEWAGFCDLAASAGVASGTDALSLALIASGAVRKGAGDEVIVPTLTAPYTALAVLNAGGVPIFADIDPDIYTLDPNAIETALTSRTRAIIPVHLYGQMADMPAICKVADRHQLIVIEDAAQAHGARQGGRSPGAFGMAAAFSFYPTKNLGGFGDGGAVVSNDPRLIEKIKILRQGGHEPASSGQLEGRNSRLDELQAALLRVKLKHLADWNQRRKNLAAIYKDALAPAAGVRRPVVREPHAHVFHLYVVAHNDREGLRAYLAAREIETMVHYPHLLHQQKLFQRSKTLTLPVAESLLNRIVSLPLYPQLTESEVRAVAQAVVEFETDSQH